VTGSTLGRRKQAATCNNPHAPVRFPFLDLKKRIYFVVVGNGNPHTKRQKEAKSDNRTNNRNLLSYWFLVQNCELGGFCLSWFRLRILTRGKKKRKKTEGKKTGTIQKEGSF
jgi:hypothetical protein